MFDRDYLMRLINQMSTAFGTLMGLKEQRKHEEALIHIDDFLSRELRLRARLALGLSDKDLIAMFSNGNGEVNVESLGILAVFLQEEGILLREMGRENESVPRLEKALRLILYVLRIQGPIDGLDLERRKDMLMAAPESDAWHLETRRSVWAWQEHAGQYAAAENTLFDLHEEGEVPAEEGLDFYNRLARLPDERLTAGGLPREELLEGIRQWNSLNGKAAG